MSAAVAYFGIASQCFYLVNYSSHPIEVIDGPGLVFSTSEVVLDDVGVWVTGHLLLGVIVSNARELKTYCIHIHAVGMVA